MKKVFAAVLLLLLFYSAGLAQPAITGQKTIGGNSFDGFKVDVTVTRDGGLVVGGSSTSNKSGEKTQNFRGSTDCWVLKLKGGKIQWDRTFGGNITENFKAVIQTSDGGYALIGESDSYISVEKDEYSRGDLDYWLVKLDKDGNIQWNKTIGGFGRELIDNIVQTADGGFILAGTSDSYPAYEKTGFPRGATDYWVVKVDRNGQVLWDKTIGGSAFEFCTGLALTRDGGMIINGFSESNISGEKTENSRGGFDYWVVKLDKQGNIQWDKTIGGDGTDLNRGIYQNVDGSYVINGMSNSNISGEKSEMSRGFFDYWTVMLDKNGHLLRDKTIGGSGDDIEVWSIEKTSDGGYVFGGASNSNISGEKSEASRGDFDYWVVKLRADLSLEWEKTIGGNNFDVVHSVREVKKDQYVIAGMSLSFISGDKTEDSRGDFDYWLVWLEDKHSNGHSPHENTEGSPLVIHEDTDKSGFALYPNPTKNTVYINLKTGANFTMSDMSGKIIREWTMNGNGVIDISGLVSGTYLIKNKGTGESKKIMVTH
jgi:hypothetical protein